MRTGSLSSLRTKCNTVRGAGTPRKLGYERKTRNLIATKAAGSSFGHMFRITTFGESHGGGVGCVVDGVPARLNITQVNLAFLSIQMNIMSM